MVVYDIFNKNSILFNISLCFSLPYMFLKSLFDLFYLIESLFKLLKVFNSIFVANTRLAG